MKTALIVVDLQNDFIYDKLKIDLSESIIEKTNNIIKYFDIVCYTKNIFEYKEIKEEKEKITISDNSYCMKGTTGSEFPENLKINKNIFYRSYNDNFNSLVGLNDDNKNLKDFLKENDITHVFISGIPGDYSVKYTALDSIKEFKTFILADMIKTLTNMNNFIDFCIRRKIPIISSGDINVYLNGKNYKNRKQKTEDKKQKTKMSYNDIWWVGGG